MQQDVHRPDDSISRVVRVEFDSPYYRSSNADVARSGIDPVSHYVNYGWKEGRFPRPDFDPKKYLECNADVAAAGLEPFFHYLRFGREECRAPYGAGISASEPSEAPSVSILIPAFRPDFLDTCILSALAQTYQDFEILISDDSIGDAVQSVVSKWQDTRIRYLSNPRRQEPGANRDYLIEKSRGTYLKFIFDDDYLLPNSLSTLMDIAQRYEADMAFHARYEVDDRGRIDAATIPFGFQEPRTIDEKEFADRVIARSENVIGEPSNILISKDALLQLDNPFMLHGRRMRFLTDVALYCNLFDAGLRVALVGNLGSAFRRHAAQNSKTKGPIYAAGIFEWEFILRWAADRGWVKDDGYLQAMARLFVELYRPNRADYPELDMFIELAGRGSGGKYLTNEYLSILDAAHQAIDARVRRSRIDRTGK